MTNTVLAVMMAVVTNWLVVEEQEIVHIEGSNILTYVRQTIDGPVTNYYKPEAGYKSVKLKVWNFVDRFPLTVDNVYELRTDDAVVLTTYRVEMKYNEAAAEQAKAVMKKRFKRGKVKMRYTPVKGKVE